MISLFQAIIAFLIVLPCMSYPVTLELVERDDNNVIIRSSAVPTVFDLQDIIPGLVEEFGHAIANVPIEIPITAVCPYPELCDSEEGAHLSHFEKAECILKTLARSYEITRRGSFHSDLKGDMYVPVEDETSILLRSVKQLGKQSVVNLLVAADFLSLLEEHELLAYYLHPRKLPYFQYRVIRALEPELQNNPSSFSRLPVNILNRINYLRQHPFFNR